MKDQKNSPPQSSLILRIFGGIYLVYLAWSMRDAIADEPLYLIPIIVFAVVGVALAGHSIWVLTHHPYFRKDPETESTEELEDQSNA